MDSDSSCTTCLQTRGRRNLGLRLSSGYITLCTIKSPRGTYWATTHKLQVNRPMITPPFSTPVHASICAFFSVSCPSAPLLFHCGRPLHQHGYPHPNCASSPSFSGAPVAVGAAGAAERAVYGPLAGALGQPSLHAVPRLPTAQAT